VLPSISMEQTLNLFDMSRLLYKGSHQRAPSSVVGYSWQIYIYPESHGFLQSFSLLTSNEKEIDVINSCPKKVS
jgi:hypothetical protein